MRLALRDLLSRRDVQRAQLPGDGRGDVDVVRIGITRPALVGVPAAAGERKCRNRRGEGVVHDQSFPVAIAFITSAMRCSMASSLITCACSCAPSTLGATPIEFNAGAISNGMPSAPITNT